MLDVTRLRVLDAVARHGSVTAAARELDYSQSSVSHHLARLEAETGAQLLQRAGRGIRLTQAGRLLADRAAGDLAGLSEATWVAGCPRCRGHLLALCRTAGFEPHIGYESDDMVLIQALVAAGLCVATLPGLALRAHRADG